MKTVCLFLMFGISSAMGMYYGYFGKERIKTLEELINFLKYLIIRISAKNGNLKVCINTYIDSPRIEEFLSRLTYELDQGSINPFMISAEEMSYLDTPELEIIKNINIGSLDYLGQIKAIEQAVCRLEAIENQLKSNIKKNNAVSYSGVLFGLALVIIFI